MAIVAVLLDSHRGVYIPRDFAQDFRFAGPNGQEGWEGIDPENLEILRKGPDEEFYWEAWENVLNNAFYKNERPIKLDGVTFPAGVTFRLEQDGDLFMMDDREDDRDYQEAIKRYTKGEI